MEPKGTEHSKALPRSKRYRTERSHSPFSQVLLLPFQAAKDGSPSTEEVLKTYLPGEFLPLLPHENPLRQTCTLSFSSASPREGAQHLGWPFSR